MVASGATSWFKKIPTWAKITSLVGAPILTAEIYNEIAGAVSGKKWYSGKYSFVNLARGKGEDKNPELNKGPGSVGKDENREKIDNNIDDKIYTNSGDKMVNKDSKDLGTAPCIGKKVVSIIKEGINCSKKDKMLLQCGYNKVDVDSEVDTVIMLLSSVAKSNVVDYGGYENLRKIFENDDKNFKILTVDFYGEVEEKKLCYTLKFNINGNWIGYTMRKVNDELGMVQKVKYNGAAKKWGLDGEASEFKLIK